MTTQEIKAYCEKTGKRYEEHFACSFIRDGFVHGRSNQIMSEQSDYSIGVEMNDLVWYWWFSYDLNGYESDNLYFRQRYSQRTGQEASGALTGIRAERKMKKALRDDSLKLHFAYNDGVRLTEWCELHWSDDKIKFRLDHYLSERTYDYLKSIQSHNMSLKEMMKEYNEFLDDYFEEIVADTKKYRNGELNDDKFLQPIYTKGE